MNRDMEQDPRDAELERLLARAGRPSAAPAFRTRLKEQFLAEATARPTIMVPQRTRMFPFVWPFVLAASVVFILYYVMSRDANVRWHVVGTEGGGDYIVDGRRMHSSETGRLLEAVQTAHEIETFEAPLRLQLTDELVLELAPKTRVSQLSFPAAHLYSIYVNVGSLRVTTGPKFDRQRLRALTDGMETVVVGTTFGLDVDASGTCLCCVAGTVKCDARDGRGMMPADAGRSCFAYHNGQKPKWDAAVPAHAEPLERLKSFAAAIWKKQ